MFGMGDMSDTERLDLLENRYQNIKTRIKEWIKELKEPICLANTDWGKSCVHTTNKVIEEMKKEIE